MQAQTKTRTSARLLESLDAIAVRLGDIATKTNRTIRIEQPNIALTVKYSQPENLELLGAENENNNVGVLMFSKDEENAMRTELEIQSKTKDGFDAKSHFEKHNETINKVYVSSKVPKGVFKNMSQVVYSFFFRDDTFFQDKRQLLSLGNDETPRSSISSAVLAVTVGTEKIENLTTPVAFKFTKLTRDEQQIEEDEIANDICTFWNPNVGKDFDFDFMIIHFYISNSAIA